MANLSWTYDSNLDHQRLDLTVTAGTTSDPLPIEQSPRPITVTALPGASGTALVQFTTSPKSAIDAGTAKWIDWSPGSVGANTSSSFTTPITGLRFSATTADATFEVIR